MLNRRGFLYDAVAAILAVSGAGLAQPAEKRARVGFLTASGRFAFEVGERRLYRDAFTGRLGELGWTEGQNLVIENRYADGHYGRLPALATDLVRVPVDVIFANAAPSAQAAKQVTASIPIVFETLGDPITAGLVSSLGRPGGNLTAFPVSAPNSAVSGWSCSASCYPGYAAWCS